MELKEYWDFNEKDLITFMVGKTISDVGYYESEYGSYILITFKDSTSIKIVAKGWEDGESSFKIGFES